jgi:hypothetical protein
MKDIIFFNQAGYLGMIIMGMYSIPVIKWRPTLDIP